MCGGRRQERIASLVADASRRDGTSVRRVSPYEELYLQTLAVEPSEQSEVAPHSHCSVVGLQCGVGRAQSLSVAHSQRLLVALHTLPPLAAVQLVVHTPASVQLAVHGSSHRPRRSSHVLDTLAQTS